MPTFITAVQLDALTRISERDDGTALASGISPGRGEKRPFAALEKAGLARSWSHRAIGSGASYRKYVLTDAGRAEMAAQKAAK